MLQISRDRFPTYSSASDQRTVCLYIMRKILKPAWLEIYTGIYRQSGWKGIIKTGGIRLLIAFFLFYLIRDSILYLLPIYLAMQGIQSCYN